MIALDLLIAGQFNEAIEAYQQELEIGPAERSSLAGLASAFMGAGRYNEAIPVKWKVNENNKVRNPDSPGQLLELSCAYWCLDDHYRAIDLARQLCASILDGSVSMAPDQAGGATFGLILHYMAVTGGDEGNRDYALDYLRSLNLKYDKRPTLFSYPVQTVKQLLGEMTFEDALEAATKQRSLPAAFEAAKPRQLALPWLGIALFHDGAIRRASGDETGCIERMRQVYELGYQTESIRWQLARHEVVAK
jgi:tetratricopeptide (TPR) repeat protein